ncbi:MAG: hypothetical protein ACRDCI_17470, partial [Plesiomonas shigelloides]
FFPLSAKTAYDVDSVLDIISGEIGAGDLKDELKQEIDKIPVIEKEIDQLAKPGDISAAVEVEKTERVAADSALSSLITTVKATADNTAAGLQTEMTARADADTALGKRIDTVTATTGSNTAAIQSEVTARTTADEALSQRIETLKSTVGQNTAAIQSEATARADADSALSKRIDTVQATAGNNTAAIQSEATSRADADSALSKRVDTVQATVGQNTASIQTVATAGTTNDGETMNAMWSTRASLNDITGGFGLIAEQDPDGKTRVKFIVDADIFAILDRSGGKRNPFVIKDGIVYMNKLLLDNAEIGEVISKYIKVDVLDGTVINAGSIRGGAASFGLGGPYDAWGDGRKWHTVIGYNGSISTDSLYATSGVMTGTVNAQAGTFNNVTINENCNVLGTV